MAALGAVWRYRRRLRAKVESVQVGEIKDALSDGAGGLADLAKSAAGTAKEATGEAVGTITDAVKGAGHDASRVAARSARRVKRST
jgi:hypothetical protein